MTSDEIKAVRDDLQSGVLNRMPQTEPLWEIAYQLSVQSAQQAESIRLLTRTVELQELVHLARPAELETLRKRVDELLNANNAEVERRRRAEGERDVWLTEVKHLRETIVRISEKVGLAERSEPKRDAVGKRDPKQKPEPGTGPNWKCTVCGWTNYDIRMRCRECGRPRNYEHLGTCPHCGGNNGAHREGCHG